MGCEFPRRILEEPKFPENQVFALRPAKPKELRAFIREDLDEQEAEKLAELRAMAELGFPIEIANFRILPCVQEPSKVVLANVYGERFEARDINYYCPRSSHTMKVRALNNNSSWFGTTEMIAPFTKFCLETPPEISSAIIRRINERSDNFFFKMAFEELQDEN